MPFGFLLCTFCINAICPLLWKQEVQILCNWKACLFIFFKKNKKKHCLKLKKNKLHLCTHQYALMGTCHFTPTSLGRRWRSPHSCQSLGLDKLLAGPDRHLPRPILFHISDP
uniref:Secreted protein n=1 Tax=Anguilla anguilla TaxID=7936 RepID=A0A0E9X7D6_ANGAN